MGAKARVGMALLVAVGVIAALIVALGAGEARHDPERCSPGLVAIGPRCCAPGQKLESGRCSGRPASCPSGLELGADADQGCALIPTRVRIAGGWLNLSVSDWEVEGV